MASASSARAVTANRDEPSAAVSKIWWWLVGLLSLACFGFMFYAASTELAQWWKR